MQTESHDLFRGFPLTDHLEDEMEHLHSLVDTFLHLHFLLHRPRSVESADADDALDEDRGEYTSHTSKFASDLRRGFSLEMEHVQHGVENGKKAGFGRGNGAEKGQGWVTVLGIGWNFCVLSR